MGVLSSSSRKCRACSRHLTQPGQSVPGACRPAGASRVRSSGRNNQKGCSKRRKTERRIYYPEIGNFREHRDVIHRRSSSFRYASCTKRMTWIDWHGRNPARVDLSSKSLGKREFFFSSLWAPSSKSPVG